MLPSYAKASTHGDFDVPSGRLEVRPMIVNIDCDAAALGNASGKSGLLVGIPSAFARSYRILAFVPTAPSPADANIDAWTALHAEAVQRHLPGGLSLLGSFALADTRIQNASTSLSGIDSATRLARRILNTADVRPSAPKSITKLIIYHDQIGRPAGYVISAGEDGQAAVGAANLQVISDLARDIRILTSTVSFATSVLAKEDQQRFGAFEQFSLEDDSLESLCLAGAHNALQRVMLQLSPDTIVVSEGDTREMSSVNLKGENVNHCHEIQVLTPVSSHVPRSTKGLVCGRYAAKFSGDVRIFAVLASDASLGEALNAVRSDLGTTLHLRARLLKETLSELDADSLHASKSPELPARVFIIPKRFSGVPYTDYILQDENISDDVVPRLAELMSWTEIDLLQYNFAVVEQHSSSRAIDSSSSSVRGEIGSSAPASSWALKSFGRLGLTCGMAGAAIVLCFAMVFQLHFGSLISYWD